MDPEDTAGRQAVVFIVGALPDADFSSIDMRLSGLTVSRFMFSSSLTRLSVLEEPEDEVAADACSPAIILSARAGLAFITAALSAERRTSYMESAEVDPEAPSRML
jgi:hypothetical protein